MKKLIFITALALTTIVSTSIAQDHFAVGLKAGYTSTQYTTNNLSNPTHPSFNSVRNDARGGYVLGGYARIKLIGNVSFQPEMYFAKKSGLASYSLNNVSQGEQGIDLYSWDIPLLANLTILDLKIVKVYGITGPVLSFVTKNASDVSLQNISSKDDVSKANWGYQLGAGVQAWKLTLDARYEWGLNNVSNGLSNIDFERKGNMLTISLGYRLFGL